MLNKCCQYISNTPLLLKELIVKVKDHLQIEKQRLFIKHTVWYVSSDVLESMLGMFKNKKSQTRYTALFPSLIKIAAGKPTVDCNLKNAPEEVMMTHLWSWERKKLNRESSSQKI